MLVTEKEKGNQIAQGKTLECTAHLKAIKQKMGRNGMAGRV